MFRVVSRSLQNSYKVRSIYASPLLFPGQGAQHIGMGKMIKEEGLVLFSIASDILGMDLLRLCNEGPDDVLESTKFSQTAIFVTSMAILRSCTFVKPSVVMGLSLGEYTALCCAGVFTFEDGVNLTRIRGLAMQQACDQRPGKMCTIIGLSSVHLEEICLQISHEMNLIVKIANYLAPKYYVIAGDKLAVEAVLAFISTIPEVKSIPINVSGAFHTELMLPAQDMLATAIKNTSFKIPTIPIIMNVNAQVILATNVQSTEPISSTSNLDCNLLNKTEDSIIHDIKDNLMSQLTQPVQWENTMRRILIEEHSNEQCPPSTNNNNNHNTNHEQYRKNICIDVGPGNTISAIIKKFNRRHTVKQLNV